MKGALLLTILLCVQSACSNENCLRCEELEVKTDKPQMAALIYSKLDPACVNDTQSINSTESCHTCLAYNVTFDVTIEALETELNIKRVFRGCSSRSARDKRELRCETDMTHIKETLEEMFDPTLMVISDLRGVECLCVGERCNDGAVLSGCPSVLATSLAVLLMLAWLTMAMSG